MTELLLDGWVMYRRQSVFSGRNPPGIDASLLPPPRTADGAVRRAYPETTLFDTWTSAGPSGRPRSVTLELSEAGKLLNLPVQLGDSVARVDIATGVVMVPDLPSPDMGPGIEEMVAEQFAAIDRNRDAGRTESTGVYLGRPSVIFEGTFEYQLANPFIYHEIRTQHDEAGMAALLSEAHTLDFALFPPGSMPEVATWPREP